MSDQRDHRRRRAIQNQRSAGVTRGRRRSWANGELLPKGDVLQNQRGAAAEGRSESAEEQQDEADHGRRRVGEAGRNVNDRRKYELWRATTCVQLGLCLVPKTTLSPPDPSVRRWKRLWRRGVRWGTWPSSSAPRLSSPRSWLSASRSKANQCPTPAGPRLTPNVVASGILPKGVTQCASRSNRFAG